LVGSEKKGNIQRLINTGNIIDAEYFLNQYLSTGEFDDDISIFDASIQNKKANTPAAKLAINKGLLYNSKNYELYFMLGNYNETNGNFERAALCYRQAIHYCTSSTEDLHFLKDYVNDFFQSNSIYLLDTTIIIIPNHDKLCTEQCIKYIEELNDMDHIHAVIAKNEINLSYLVEDCMKIHPLSDVLIMSSEIRIMPNVVFNLKMALYGSNDIGAVSPVSNAFLDKQHWSIQCESIQEYIDFSKKFNVYNEENHEKSLTLNNHFILFKKDALNHVGNFDKQFFQKETAVMDLCLRLIKSSYSLHICKDTFVACKDNKLIIPPSDMNPSLLSDKDRLKTKWGMNYFNMNSNPHLVEMIEEEKNTSIHVLEIGCDCGATLLAIQNSYPEAKIYGVELNENAAAIANGFADVIVANIENLNLPYAEKYFDYILFGDVLEHLHDPKMVLEYSKKYLKNTGKIVASIPNIMHVSVIKSMIHGNWSYMDTGLLDRTHIHFFTYNEILRMFDLIGLSIKNSNSIMYKLNDNDEEYIDKLMILDTATPRFMFQTFQYVICAGMDET